MVGNIVDDVLFQPLLRPLGGSGVVREDPGGSAGTVREDNHGGPLFVLFYPFLCRDRGEVPVARDHTQQVLDEGLSEDAYNLKGPRVALKRW